MNSSTPPDTARAQALREEALYLHAALYSCAPMPDIVDAYLRAHHHHGDELESATSLRQIISRGLDVEALELVERRDRHALTKKLRILVYITEGQPRYYRQFVNQSDRPVVAWLSLAVAVVRTAWKYLKGRYLLGRYAGA